VVRKRVLETWCGEGEVSYDRLVGTQGAAEIPRHFGAGSLFASRKVIVLTDPIAGEKGTPLSSLGKNQLAALEATCKSIPKEMDLLLIETGMMKKTSAVTKTLAGLAFSVDTTPPKGAVRRSWIELMARRSQVNLAPDLMEALSASEIPLGTVLADLNKLAIAVEEGAEATMELWRDLTQSSPEVSIWEMGDFLTQGKTAQVLRVLKDLRAEGLRIHELLPALFTWNQQRLQIRSNQLAGTGKDPEGIHPFVLRKIGSQISKLPIDRLRKEGMALYRLDRISKQSLEDPEIALEKTLTSFSERRM
jgi:DNA polymerase III delta subunit